MGPKIMAKSIKTAAFEVHLTSSVNSPPVRFLKIAYFLAWEVATKSLLSGQPARPQLFSQRTTLIRADELQQRVSLTFPLLQPPTTSGKGTWDQKCWQSLVRLLHLKSISQVQSIAACFFVFPVTIATCNKWRRYMGPKMLAKSIKTAALEVHLTILVNISVFLNFLNFRQVR